MRCLLQDVFVTCASKPATLARTLNNGFSFLREKRFYIDVPIIDTEQKTVMQPRCSNSAHPGAPELRTNRHRKGFLCEKPSSNAKRFVGSRLATNNRDPEIQMGRSTIRAARQVPGAWRRRKMISQR